MSRRSLGSAGSEALRRAPRRHPSTPASSVPNIQPSNVHQPCLSRFAALHGLNCTAASTPTHLNQPRSCRAKVRGTGGVSGEGANPQETTAPTPLSPGGRAGVRTGVRRGGAEGGFPARATPGDVARPLETHPCPSLACACIFPMHPARREGSISDRARAPQETTHPTPLPSRRCSGCARWRQKGKGLGGFSARATPADVARPVKPTPAPPSPAPAFSRCTPREGRGSLRTGRHPPKKPPIQLPSLRADAAGACAGVRKGGAGGGFSDREDPRCRTPRETTLNFARDERVSGAAATGRLCQVRGVNSRRQRLRHAPAGNA